MVKRPLLLALLFFCHFLLQAQILEPIKWNIQLKNFSKTDKEIVFTAKIDEGWHLYNMNLPSGGPVSTSFHFEKIQGAVLDEKTTAHSKAVNKKDDIFGLELSWFVREAVFIQKLHVTNEKKFVIEGYIEFMGCNDATCLPPTPEKFKFSSKDLVHLQSTNKASPTIAPLQTVSLNTSRSDSAVIVNSPNLNTVNSNQLWSPVIRKLHSFDKSGISDHTSWWILFISGFIGGLLALLTPCVWPIIPMTVSFFLKRNKSRRKAIKEALLYGLSIIAIYLILGLGITIIFGASALNSLSTNAIFNLFFFALLVTFSISFFGAFEMTLPSSWTNKIDKKADTTTGIISIFFMAFTLVLVSFSCTGPIIGTLLVQAATMNAFAGPAIGMFGFALALAIPFSFFAIFPNMMQNMPKSGSWLNTVKVILGFLELALALKFLSVADLAYGWRILDRETFLAIWIVLFALLGLYLLGKIKLPNDRTLEHISVLRLLSSILSFSFAVYMIPGLWGAPLKSISAFAPPMYTQDFNLYKNEVHAAFNDYETGMEYARKVGKPVIIDFSGYGCVNCRKMENAVWQDVRVKSLLENNYVLISLMVDDKAPLTKSIEINEFGKTRNLKTIGDKWSYLQRYKFGSNAQPFYVLLDNQGQPIGPSYAYNENVDKYIRFLKDGVSNFNKTTRTY
jgi:thiol:disulfide interchange protein DsbD